MNDINNLTSSIIAAAIEVHNILGPGLLEKMYERALVCELGLRGIKAVPQVPVYPTYKGIELVERDEPPLRLDVLVEDTIVVELKSVEKMKEVYAKQLYTYLKLTHNRYGLLINFNVPLLMDGVKRVVCGF